MFVFHFLRSVFEGVVITGFIVLPLLCVLSVRLLPMRAAFAT